MAKKNSKGQLKQPNTAEFNNASTAQVNVQVPATIHHSFSKFITLATVEDIKKFLELEPEWSASLRRKQSS